MNPEIIFTSTRGGGLDCSIRSPQGRELRLAGFVTDVEPDADGHPAMVRNRALVHNLWAYGKHERQYRVLRSPEKRKSHAGQAKVHKKIALNIAKLIDIEGSAGRPAWCSACMTYADHRKLETGPSRVPAYLCAPPVRPRLAAQHHDANTWPPVGSGHYASPGTALSTDTTYRDSIRRPRTSAHLRITGISCNSKGRTWQRDRKWRR